MKKLPILELRPTQFAVGMREVAHKAEKLATLKPKEADDFLAQNPVPVILAPRNRHYLIDHHHLARAAWEVGIKEIYVEAKGDFSTFEFEALWRTMRDANWLYLVDQLGNGPHQPTELPETIRGLADDPYRSISWRVRNAGGYTKNPAPFSEFRWAEFFRKRLTKHPSHDEFEAAVLEAVALARTPDAAHLPGFITGSSVPVVMASSPVLTPVPPSAPAPAPAPPATAPGPAPESHAAPTPPSRPKFKTTSFEVRTPRASDNADFGAS